MKINCLFVQILLSNMKHKKSLYIENERDKFSGNVVTVNDYKQL